MLDPIPFCEALLSVASVTISSDFDFTRSSLRPQGGAAIPAIRLKRVFLLDVNSNSEFNSPNTYSSSFVMNSNSKSGPATSYDIARRAGVSQATVSRVLTGNPKVRQELRNKVMEVIQKLNYRPNGMARAMRTSRTGNIGVAVSRLANPLYPELLQVLGRMLIHAGFRMVVWNADELNEDAAVDAVSESRVDGIIMTTATVASTRLYETLQTNAPVVLINRTVEGWPCDQVASDNRGGGQAVADYLVRSGRLRIGLIAGSALASTIRDRQSGFREQLAILGRPLDEALCLEVDHFSYKTGFEAAGRLLELAEAPDALFCVNDVIALGARDAARHRGVDVPGKLWMIGYDDIEMASWQAFDLTTVRQPLPQMVEKAIELLLERIDGGTGEYRNICLPNKLVIRGSTGWRTQGQ
ncbi:MAG: LacI family DNA-binding transcriptional regulator [Candidatus Korobacteraceae bacterium]